MSKTLEDDGKETIEDKDVKVTPAEVVENKPKKIDNTWLWLALAVLIVAIALIMYKNYKAKKDGETSEPVA